MGSLEHAIQSLGTAHFRNGLLDYIGSLALVDHLALIRFNDAFQASIVASVTRPDRRIDGKDVQRLYLNRFCRQDPNWSALASPVDEDGTVVRRLNPRHLSDGAYRYYCYESPRLIDRLSILKPAQGSLYCVNLYRSHGSGQFSDRDTAAIQQQAPVLAALAIKQDQISTRSTANRDTFTKLEELSQRLAAIDRRLTSREIDVSARIVAGMTSHAIALELGIMESSVITFRRRAYKKLRIGTQNELFSLCYFG